MEIVGKYYREFKKKQTYQAELLKKQERENDDRYIS